MRVSGASDASEVLEIGNQGRGRGWETKIKEQSGNGTTGTWLREVVAVAWWTLAWALRTSDGALTRETTVKRPARPGLLMISQRRR